MKKFKVSSEKLLSKEAIVVSVLILIVLLSSFSVLAFNSKPSTKSATESMDANTLSTVGTSGVPAKIVVTCTPPKVLADNGYHYCAIKVELQDPYGNPAYAPEGGIGVSVSSSNPTVGYPGQTYVNIYEGYTFETVSFRSTWKPGQTTIEATAAGLVSGSAIMRTVGATPYKVQVILAPDKVLAISGKTYYYPVCVQLQDSAGNPAIAPSDIGVSLNSSNTAVGTVPTYLTISTGYTFEATWFKSTSTAGTTTIKAAAAGLVGSSATMTTSAAGGAPANLVVWLAPKKQPADGTTDNYPVVVGLQDASGIPANAPAGGITVSLTSSNTTVGDVTGSLTISAGAQYYYTYFTPTYVPGKTTVRATLSGYTTGSAIMTTIGYTPTKLAVYIAPSIVFAHKKYSYDSIVVQAQDVNGNPARAPEGGYTVILTSSDMSVGTPSGSVTISAGETYESAYFYSTYKPGQTTIQASHAILAAGSAVMKTKAPIPANIGLDLALSKVLAISSKYYYEIVRILLLDSAGNPALAPSDIAVSLTSSDTGIGVVQSSVTINEGEIFTTAWFMSKATPGSTTITASASIGGVLKTTTKTMTTISPATAGPAKSVKVSPLPKYVSKDQYSSDSVVVYLVDSAGNPAKAPRDLTVSLSSSDSLVGTVPSSVGISKNEIHYYTSFRSTYRPGKTTITASTADLAPGSATVTTGAFTPISKSYKFKNLDYLFYRNTILVLGDAAHTRETTGAGLITYALSEVGAQMPIIKTDGLINSTEYTESNLIIIGYNNTKTADKNTAYGIVVSEDSIWFNITATAEGKSLNFTKSDYPGKSIAIVYLKKDGTRAVMLAWGYGWRGTYAAALFMSDTAKWQTYATKHLLFLQWTDTNANGFVEKTEITVATSA